MMVSDCGTWWIPARKKAARRSARRPQARAAGAAGAADPHPPSDTPGRPQPANTAGAPRARNRAGPSTAPGATEGTAQPGTAQPAGTHRKPPENGPATTGTHRPEPTGRSNGSSADENPTQNTTTETPAAAAARAAPSEPREAGDAKNQQATETGTPPGTSAARDRAAKRAESGTDNGPPAHQTGEAPAATADTTPPKADTGAKKPAPDASPTQKTEQRDAAPARTSDTPGQRRPRPEHSRPRTPRPEQRRGHDRRPTKPTNPQPTRTTNENHRTTQKGTQSTSEREEKAGTTPGQQAKPRANPPTCDRGSHWPKAKATDDLSGCRPQAIRRLRRAQGRRLARAGRLTHAARGVVERWRPGARLGEAEHRAWARPEAASGPCWGRRCCRRRGEAPVLARLINARRKRNSPRRAAGQEHEGDIM